jgi:hypothetical protein
MEILSCSFMLIARFKPPSLSWGPSNIQMSNPAPFFRSHSFRSS